MTDDRRPPPLPVLPLDYAPTDLRDRLARWRWWTRALVVAGAVACAAGWLLIVFVHVESVILTGPVLTVIGAFLAAGGWRSRDRRALVLGVAHVAVCLLFVALVNLREWSPNEARVPFTAMGAAYTIAAGGVSLVVFLFPRPPC